ncbi:Hypothetical protein LUCI_3955 [Lucifera butyrica]|uniref:DNA ligase D polymerase domain-containing protein n=1 Tax=Lucifera butyrica TaxID=1351585 RepID=A0A498RCN7_9FIRM|nr:non-homologous end-joining DNA ligase [Lucifera butyrica]VBB08677.1 Hypothetical protein LUCI_3955 [Lucifera butyrica]
MPEKTNLTVNGVTLQLSNLTKLYYPAAGFTKTQVIDYYIRVAPYLLPHLHNRPLTLKRYPQGASSPFFYQKECPAHRPAWLRTAPVWSEKNRRHVNFCLVEDLPSLVWAVNLAALELHTSLSLASAIAVPTTLVFDLDPGPPAGILDCCQVALWLQDIFTSYHLQSFPKTSGSKGLQIYVPLNSPVSYSQTKRFANTLAHLLETRYPLAVISNMRKNLRTGKVFVDWSQNDSHKTTVCVYSLRAREQPTVSTPLTWQEIESAWQTKAKDRLTFTAPQVLERLQQYGDLFAPLLTLQQSLPAV